MLPENDLLLSDPVPSPGYTPLSWIETWIKALTQPKVEAYEQIANDPEASVARASLWIFLSMLVAMFIGLPLSMAINPGMIDAFQQLDLGSGDAAGALAAAAGVMLCMVPLAGVFAVLGLMLSTAIVQLVARLFGGEGSFSQLFYTFAAFTTPITPISVLISSIPFVNCLGIFISIYTIVLQVIAIKAVNRFGWGAAVGALLLPGLLVFAVMCCGIIAAASVLGPVFQEALQQMQFAP
jgi:hypothetical protein